MNTIKLKSPSFCSGWSSKASRSLVTSTRRSTAVLVIRPASSSGESNISVRFDIFINLMEYLYIEFVKVVRPSHRLQNLEATRLPLLCISFPSSACWNEMLPCWILIYRDVCKLICDISGLRVDEATRCERGDLKPRNRKIELKRVDSRKFIIKLLSVLKYWNFEISERFRDDVNDDCAKLEGTFNSWNKFH